MTVLQNAQENIIDTSNTEDTIAVTCVKPKKVIELLTGKEVAGTTFEVASQRGRSATVKFGSIKNSKKETTGTLKKFMKNDTYFSNLMVQIK